MSSPSAAVSLQNTACIEANPLLSLLRLTMISLCDAMQPLGDDKELHKKEPRIVPLLTSHGFSGLHGGGESGRIGRKAFTTVPVCARERQCLRMREVAQYLLCGQPC